MSILRDIETRSQIWLERFKTGQVRDFVSHLEKGQKLATQIVVASQVETLSELNRAELAALLKAVDEQMQKAFESAINEYLQSLVDLAEQQSSFEGRIIKKSIKKNVPVKKPKKPYSKVRNLPMSANGETIEPFVKELSRRERRTLAKTIQKSWVDGETVPQAARRLRGTKARNYKDGLYNQQRRHAEAVVRTSTQHVSSASREATWKANKDIVQKYEWVSTLDSKTTTVCKSLDGQEFEIGKGPTPPIHINCRSTTVPVLNKEFTFLDEDATRSSSSGPVDADQSYYEWLKQQPPSVQDEALGKTRGKLFRDGGLSVRRFEELQLSKTFEPLTLDEMRELEPNAFKDAGL